MSKKFKIANVYVRHFAGAKTTSHKTNIKRKTRSNCTSHGHK